MINVIRQFINGLYRSLFGYSRFGTKKPLMWLSFVVSVSTIGIYNMFFKGADNTIFVYISVGSILFGMLMYFIENEHYESY